MTDQEHLLIAWTRDIVRDGSISINAVCPGLSSERPEDLVNCTIEVWCHIMQGDSPWPFISMLGDAVVEYKTICRHDHRYQEQLGEFITLLFLSPFGPKKILFKWRLHQSLYVDDRFIA